MSSLWSHVEMLSRCFVPTITEDDEGVCAAWLNAVGRGSESERGSQVLNEGPWMAHGRALSCRFLWCTRVGWEGELCQQWAMGIAGVAAAAMRHAPCAQRARIARHGQGWGSRWGTRSIHMLIGPGQDIPHIHLDIWAALPEMDIFWICPGYLG